MSLRPASSSAKLHRTPLSSRCNRSRNRNSTYHQEARVPCRHESQENKTPAPENAACQRGNETIVRHARQRTNYMAKSYHAPYVRLARLLPRQENLRRLAGDARNQKSQFAHLPDQAAFRLCSPAGLFARNADQRRNIVFGKLEQRT